MENKVREETMCVIKTFLSLKTIEDPDFDPVTLPDYTDDILRKVRETIPDADRESVERYMKGYLTGAI